MAHRLRRGEQFTDRERGSVFHLAVGLADHRQPGPPRRLVFFAMVQDDGGSLVPCAGYHAGDLVVVLLGAEGQCTIIVQNHDRAGLGDCAGCEVLGEVCLGRRMSPVAMMSRSRAAALLGQLCPTRRVRSAREARVGPMSCCRWRIGSRSPVGFEKRRLGPEWSAPTGFGPRTHRHPRCCVPGAETPNPPTSPITTSSCELSVHSAYIARANCNYLPLDALYGRREHFDDAGERSAATHIASLGGVSPSRLLPTEVAPT